MPSRDDLDVYPLASSWGRRLCWLLRHQYRWLCWPEPHRICIWCGHERVYESTTRGGSDER